MIKPYDASKHVRIRRSAKTDEVDGNLVRLGEPVALTLTNRPANERPFQVIRSDGDGIGGAAPAKRVVRKVQRNDSPVLCLTFPEGFTEDDVTAALAAYEMSHYVVDVDDAGIYRAKRADLQSIAELKTTDIKLNDAGVVASIDASQYTIQRAESKENIAIVALEFDMKRFDADAVSSWIAENKVDTAKPAVENATSNSLTVQRSEVADGTDTRRVQLEEGVVAVIARSEVADVPQAFIECVGESAYGSWGWGHIDFDTSMADRAFCTAMEDASFRLRNVLDNILLHNQLPLEARKQLVDRSLAQYGEFVKNVIDALPRQVMLLVTRSAETKESNTMINVGQKTTPAATTVQRSEDNQVVAQPAAATADVSATAEAAPADESVTMTRAEMDAKIAEAVTAELAKRSEATAAAATDAAAAAVTDGSTQAQMVATDTITAPAATITRADLEAAVAAATAPLIAKVEEMSNTVILRSDTGDRAVRTQEANTNVKRSADEVFKGAFGFPGLSV